MHRAGEWSVGVCAAAWLLAVRCGGEGSGSGPGLGDQSDPAGADGTSVRPSFVSEARPMLWLIALPCRSALPLPLLLCTHAG